MKEQLLGIERKLWTNDGAFYAETLIDEAVLVFAETGPIGRDFAVAAIGDENTENRRWTETHFDDVRILPTSLDAAMLIYKVRARRERDPALVSALCSSLYVRRNGGWKLAFHQQTPVDA